MANLEELQAAVLGIPGVVGAEVTPQRSGRPRVRVWTDDSRDTEAIHADVKSVVARARAAAGTGLGPPVVIREPEAPPGGPSAPEEDDVFGTGPPGGGGGGFAPSRLVSIDLTQPPSLDMIAIEESANGVTVRASDTDRNVAEAKAMSGPSSINPAIVTAVAELLGALPAPRLVSVELRDTEAASVLVVTLEMADRSIAAGAAVVQGGMPFTLGKAAWAAIKSVHP